jgi:23S rRNA (uracil1939-C5)-methyltransferase
MEIKIEKLDHYGKGIGYSNDKIVFVNNALPEEIVDIKIVKDKKSYSEAIVLEYIKTSDKRVKPKCQYYQVCGGCDIMHMDYDEQHAFKLNKVKEIINKYTKVDSSLIKEIIYDKQYNYRNKIVLRVNGKVGYYKKGSNEIVNIDNCLIADPSINEVILKLNEIDLFDINEITIRKLDKIMILVDLSQDRKLDSFIELFNKANIVKKVNNEYSLVHGNNYISTKINDIEFRVSIESFFQVNNEVTNLLYSKIIDYAKESKNVLDLFCGTGTIGMVISKDVDEVTGIEINSQAISDALVNKEINYIKNVNFINGDVYNHLDDLKDIDLVIVDPPRSGLADKTIKQIMEMNPKKIIYVSCDPITLARDMNKLDKYLVKEVTLFDMFPNTHHVESLVVLENEVN